MTLIALGYFLSLYIVLGCCGRQVATIEVVQGAVSVVASADIGNDIWVTHNYSTAYGLSKARYQLLKGLLTTLNITSAR
jgi:hypothetical protein